MNDLSDERLIDLVGSAYAAATEPIEWERFLGRLARETRSTMAALLFVDTSSGGGKVNVSWGADPEDLKRYNDYYSRINPVMDRARSLGLMAPGTIRRSHEIINSSQLKRCEYYTDFLHPAGFDFGLGCTVLGEEASLSTLTLQRSPAGGPYTDPEAKLVEGLIPHLRRVIEINERLARERAMGIAASRALESAQVGLFVVGGHGRVLEKNAAADRLLSQRDGLRLDRDGLHGATPAATRALSRLVDGCILLARGQGLPPSQPLLLPRPSGRRPFQLLAMPTGPAAALVSSTAAAAVVFAVDPDLNFDVDASLLSALGLTPAERRLALRLAAGDSLREAADLLLVSYETARSQLKGIFARTGTRRQSELVAMLGRLSLLGRGAP